MASHVMRFVKFIISGKLKSKIKDFFFLEDTTVLNYEGETNSNIA
jgi:hypothetical protein